jgi:hypothetical protein
MSSFHTTPDFSFVSWPGIVPPTSTEDYNAIWSDYADSVQPSAMFDPFLGGLVSLVSCGISKDTNGFVSQDVHNVDPFGNAINDADFINNLDEVNEVSIPCLVLDRAHLLILLHHRIFQLPR